MQQLVFIWVAALALLFGLFLYYPVSYHLCQHAPEEWLCGTVAVI